MSRASTQSRKSPRILIIRLSAIGDVVQAMPVACALRERFPNALLAWAVERRGATLLEGHEALDEVITLERGWLKSPRTVRQLRRRLHRIGFDVALEIQGLTKAAIVAWLSGARRRIGFGDPWGRELSRWINNEVIDTTAPHVVDRNLELLRPLEIEWPSVRFRVPQRQADRLAADRMLRELGVPEAFAMINAGAGWPSKLWPNYRYAEVARYLGRQRGLPTLVVWGGADERAMAREVVTGAGGHARLAPDTTLGVLASLARRAGLFLGSDTGPLHLAAAVETPCVGLFGPWPAERHGPYGPRHIALQSLHFAGSTRQRRHASPEYMEAITVEQVCRACDRILNRDGHDAASFVESGPGGVEGAECGVGSATTR